MSLPAARLGDMHVCPMFDGPKPHVGGPITGPCTSNVMIGGLPAATVGDMCTCTGTPDTIVMGSSNVLIGGKPAARIGDSTSHGGTIVLGCFTVMIGSSGGGAGGGGGANNQFNKKGASQAKKEQNSKSLQDSAKKDATHADRKVKQDYSAQYTLTNHNGKPQAQVPYEINMNDGSKHRGKTNSNGQTLPIQGYTVGDGIVSFENKQG